MAKVSDENFIADADGVHADRSIQSIFLQYHGNSQKVKDLVATQWAMIEKQGRCLGSRTSHALSDAYRASFERIWGGPRIDQGNGRGGDRYSSSLTTRTVGGAATSAQAVQEVLACAPSTSSNTASWAVFEVKLMENQQVITVGRWARWAA